MQELRAWAKLGEERVQCGYRSILRRRFQLPNDREGTYDVKNEPDSVAVLALTTDRQVVLARQYRPGPEIILNELPGGYIGEETPLVAAKRELLEETGYIGDVRIIASNWHCAMSTCRRFAAIAEGCVLSQQPTPDDDEWIETRLATLSSFVHQVRRGELTNVETALLCLVHLGVFAPDL